MVALVVVLLVLVAVLLVVVEEELCVLVVLGCVEKTGLANSERFSACLAVVADREVGADAAEELL